MNDLPSKYKLYGWKSFRIHGILSHPLFAYFILCTCNFIQNFSVNGANNAVISTLERVFYLNSVQSGFFLALYDLATVFSSPLVGYLGRRYSSPIFFSLNMVIVGIGNLMIASSNFLYHDLTFDLKLDISYSSSSHNNVLYQCFKDPLNIRNTTDICRDQEAVFHTSNHAKILLYLGNFVNGIGSVALFTIGISYIERIFPREQAAYCQGIYFAIGTVGGALGIVATGRFLLIFTKLTSKTRLPPWLTPNHPLWIGCWWLPYIIYGTLSVIIGLFVSGLPNYEKPGDKHSLETVPSNSSCKKTLSSTNVSMVENEPVSKLTILNSPENLSPIFNKSNELKSDSKAQLNETLPSLNTLTHEYHLSNRRFRQLAPIEANPIKNPSLSINNNNNNNNNNDNDDDNNNINTQCFINHVYSSDSVYNNASSGNIDSISNNISLNNMNSIQITKVHEIPVRTISDNIRHMCYVIRELMKNPRYVLIVIANLFEGILIKGFVPFVTKYFEYQHQLATSTATLVTGAIALLSVIIGCPIGAYFMNKFSWTPMRCARICGSVFIVSSCLFLFLTLSCPELKFENTPCSMSNKDCCQSIYHPVCMVKSPHRMFLSPCHYGCTNQTTIPNNNTNLYSSCSCANGLNVELTETVCHFRRIPCLTIFVFTMTGAAFVVFITAFIQVPLLQVLLYSVPIPYQSMALGLRQTIVRVFGQTTGPLLFGFVFDQSCLVWLTDCYSRRTCKVYENRQMGLSMALSGFSTRMISGIACIIVYIYWRFQNTEEAKSSPIQVEKIENLSTKDKEREIVEAVDS